LKEFTKEMMEIETKDIRTNPHQPRKYFDVGKLSRLEESIKEHGLDDPIRLIFTGKDQDGKIDGKRATLVDGERRLRAMINIGFRKLKYGEEYIIVDSLNVDEDLEMKALISYLREDLRPIEKAKALMKLLKRRGIKDYNVAKATINRAKDYTDNAFLAEPNSRNYFIDKETIKKVASDMKIIGMSGTNALEMLSLLKLPKDIQEQLTFAPPNSKIGVEKTKLNRLGDLITVSKNQRTTKIPVTFGEELARLDDEKLMRFFLKKAKEDKWTGRKMHIMVSNFQRSRLTPAEFIEQYRQHMTNNNKNHINNELRGLTTKMDKFTSTLSSYRTINLYSMADLIRQKMFIVSGVALRQQAERLVDELNKILLTTKELAKFKEDRREEVKATPFRVRMTKNPKGANFKSFRYTIPKEVGQAYDIELEDEVEMVITAVFKKNDIQNPMKTNYMLKEKYVEQQEEIEQEKAIEVVQTIPED